MKIRITQSGYESFSGLLGDVKFENGTSLTDVSEQQAAYVAAMFITETLDAEVPASQGDEALDENDAAQKLAEAERLAAEAERERAEADAADAAAQAAAEEAAAAQVKQVAK